jgi:hypothetical protein
MASQIEPVRHPIDDGLLPTRAAIREFATSRSRNRPRPFFRPNGTLVASVFATHGKRARC